MDGDWTPDLRSPTFGLPKSDFTTRLAELSEREFLHLLKAFAAEGELNEDLIRSVRDPVSTDGRSVAFDSFGRAGTRATMNDIGDDEAGDDETRDDRADNTRHGVDASRSTGTADGGTGRSRLDRPAAVAAQAQDDGHSDGRSDGEADGDKTDALRFDRDDTDPDDTDLDDEQHVRFGWDASNPDRFDLDREQADESDRNETLSAEAELTATLRALLAEPSDPPTPPDPPADPEAPHPLPDWLLRDRTVEPEDVLFDPPARTREGQEPESFGWERDGEPPGWDDGGLFDESALPAPGRPAILTDDEADDPDYRDERTDGTPADVDDVVDLNRQYERRKPSVIRRLGAPLLVGSAAGVIGFGLVGLTAMLLTTASDQALTNQPVGALGPSARVVVPVEQSLPVSGRSAAARSVVLGGAGAATGKTGTAEVSEPAAVGATGVEPGGRNGASSEDGAVDGGATGASGAADGMTDAGTEPDPAAGGPPQAGDGGAGGGSGGAGNGSGGSSQAALGTNETEQARDDGWVGGAIGGGTTAQIADSGANDSDAKGAGAADGAVEPKSAKAGAQMNADTEPNQGPDQRIEATANTGDGDGAEPGGVSGIGERAATAPAVVAGDGPRAPTETAMTGETAEAETVKNGPAEPALKTGAGDGGNRMVESADGDADKPTEAVDADSKVGGGVTQGDPADTGETMEVVEGADADERADGTGKTEGTEPRPAADAEGDGGFMVQVASCLRPENAARLQRQLRSNGLPAYITVWNGPDETWHVVRVSGFSSSAAAEQAARRVKALTGVAPIVRATR